MNELTQDRRDDFEANTHSRFRMAFECARARRCVRVTVFDGNKNNNNNRRDCVRWSRFEAEVRVCQRPRISYDRTA